MGTHFHQTITACLVLALFLSACQPPAATPSPQPNLEAPPPEISLPLIVAPVTAPTPVGTPTLNQPIIPVSSAPDGITAREGYPLAEQTAKAWNPDAQLAYITIGNDLKYAVSLAGRSLAWVYAFFVPGVQPGVGLQTSLEITVGPMGVIGTKPSETATIQFPLAPLSSWVLDSPTIVAAAEAGGGLVFRKKYSNFAIMLNLAMYSSDPIGQPKTIWMATYYDLAGTREMLGASFDARNGNFLPQFSQIPDSLVTSPFFEQTTLTARDGYAAAQKAAREWKPNAALISAESDKTGSQEVSITGRSKSWSYTFIDSTLQPNIQKTITFEASVGPQGLISSQQIEQGNEAYPRIEISQWMLDSSEAIAAIELRGGEVYREKCPDSSITASLLLHNIPSGPQAALWLIQYSNKTCNVTDLIAVLNASTGEFYSQFSQIPEWLDTGATGQAAITALEGLKTAMKKAQAWQSTAALYKICGTAIDLDGKANTWSYDFLPTKGEGQVAEIQGLHINLRSDGVAVVNETKLNPAGVAPDWTEVKLDSPQIVQIAEQNGGKDLRTLTPGLGISICLETESPQSLDTSPGIVWNLKYLDSAENNTATYYIEDPSGLVLEWHNEQYLKMYDYAPISDHVAYTTAEQFALAWDDSARLVYADSVSGASSHTGSITADGKAILWEMQFVAPLDDTSRSSARVLFLTVSTQGIESYVKREIPATYEAFDMTNWKVTSAQAMTLAESTGGKAFRESYPSDTKVRATLSLDKSLDPVQSLAWVITYTSSERVLKFTIDATSGEMINR